MSKDTSRPARWSKACGDAMDAVQRLLDLQQEYQDWYDNLPENMQEGATGEKLTAVTDLDLQGAYDTVEEADGTELPKGFGRD